MKRKPGRPKLVKGKRQEATMTFRALPADRKAIGIAAKTSGLKMSEWIRKALLDAAKPLPATFGQYLAAEMKEWRLGDGKDCCNPTTLGASARVQEYLENRLMKAFNAGADAALKFKKKAKD
jgi:hypothetical protein